MTAKAFFLSCALCSALLAPAQTDSLLNVYLTAAAEHNAAVKAAYLSWQATLERIPQAAAFDNPSLQAGVFVHPMTLPEGKQTAQFQLMQMFPQFGLRNAAKKEAMHRATMAYQQYREAKDQLFLQVHTQWYVLCRLQQQLTYNKENRQLLERLEALALQRLSAPGRANAKMSDVLRVRMEIADADVVVANLLASLSAEKALFNALLGRAPDSDVQTDSLQQAPLLLNPTEALLRLSHNPSLALLQAESDALNAKATADRKRSYPAFGLGLQYMLMNPTTNTAMTSMNGQNMLMPMLSISLPIYRNKYKAQQRENALLQQANQQAATEAQRQLQANLFALQRSLDNSQQQIARYRKQTDLAQSATQLALDDFATGAANLSDVLATLQRQLNYAIQLSTALADYNTLIAQLHKLASFTPSSP